MIWHRWALVATIALTLLCASGCGSRDPDVKSRGAQTSAPGDWGRYPANATLDEREVVAEYVQALDKHDGERFCAVVAPWISGRFDIFGTDPEAPLTKPLRCPRLVAGLIGYIEDCCPPKFVGATIEHMGALKRRSDAVGAPITVRLSLDEEGTRTTKMLDDVVWVTRDSGAWRIAKLSKVAAAASIALESEGDVTAAPDIADARRAFAAEVAKIQRERRERANSYRSVETSAKCEGGSAYEDATKDVIDYRHPAPSTPTPQLPAADIRKVRVRSSDGKICILFELAGKTRHRSTFDFAIQSPDFERGRSGFAQSFQVEVRADGRARVTSGLNDEHQTISVPGAVAIGGNRVMLVLDDASFVAGRPLPGSMERARPLDAFSFRADVTVVLSQKRYLHDDVGELGQRFSYP